MTHPRALEPTMTDSSSACETAVSAATVYRFFDADGSLLYVGMTTLGPARWSQHATLQPWWQDVATATVAHYPSVEAALHAETAAILAEQPVHNVMHRNPRPIRPPRIRPHGAGSVYQRQDGRWIAQISLGWQGFGRRPIRTASSRAEAELIVVEMLAQPLESWGRYRRY